MVPEGWVRATLQTLASKPISYGIVQAGEHVSDGIPYIKSSDVGGEIDVAALQRTSPEIHHKYRRSAVHPGDIVFSLRGNIAATSIVPRSLPLANLTQGTARISANATVDRRYLRYQLANPHVVKQVLALSKGSTFREISLHDLRKLEVLVPSSFSEQRKIADVLSTWDRAIEAVEKLIDNSEQQKHALMSSFFGSSEAGGWPEVELGSLGTFRKGKGITREQIVSEGLPCVTYGEIYTRHHTAIRSFQSFIPSQLASEASEIHRGDLLFAGSGETPEEIGKCVAFLGDHPAYAGGDIVILSPRQSDSLFLAYQLNHSSVVCQRIRYAQGHSVVHINASSLAGIKLRIPPTLVQQRVASILTDADRVIANCNEQRNLLVDEKRALMQQLLNGKRRVPLEGTKEQVAVA